MERAMDVFQEIIDTVCEVIDSVKAMYDQLMAKLAELGIDSEDITGAFDDLTDGTN